MYFSNKGCCFLVVLDFYESRGEIMADYISNNYIYVDCIDNSGVATYDKIVTCPSADDWCIENTVTGDLTFNGILETGALYRTAIINASIGTLDFDNDGTLEVNGAIVNQEHGDVILDNAGIFTLTGYDSTGVAGTGPALLNIGLDSDVQITNRSGATFNVYGYIHNQDGGNITINNAGTFTQVGSTFAEGYFVSLAAVNSPDLPYSETIISVNNTGVMSLTGAIYNVMGDIFITNSGDFTLSAGSNEWAIMNNGDDIEIVNDIATNPDATLVIEGSVINVGHGFISIADFTTITGYIYGEQITLSGTGEVNGGVFGSVNTDDTATSVNTIDITGDVDITGVKFDPEIVDGVNELGLGLAGAATSTESDYAGNTEITIGDLSAEESMMAESSFFMLLGATSGTVVGGNVVFGGVNVNVSGSTSGTIGANVSVTGNVFGGGYSTSANANVSGSTTVTVNGTGGTTTISGSIYGGGYAGSTFSANVGTSGTPTSTNITVQNVTVGGGIYGSGFGANARVFGTTTITLSGTVTFTGGGSAVIAPTFGASTVSGYKLMNFTDYVNSVNATVSGSFNEIAFNRDTRNLTFSIAQNWSSVGQYTFDISDRNYASYHQIAMVDLSNVTLNGSAVWTVNLKFAGQSTDYDYKLATGTDLTGLNGKTFTIYDKSNGSNVTLTVGGPAVQSSKNQNVYYQAKILNNNELWLNCINNGQGETILTWPQDYWNRYAPGSAPMVTVSSAVYLGDSSTYRYADPVVTSLNSVKAAVTLADGGTVYGGVSGSAATTQQNSWINIKSTGAAVTGGTVYGGGGNANATLNSANVYIYKDGSAGAQPVVGTVYGGGSAGTISNGTWIDVAGAHITGNIYGGGTGGTISNGTNVTFAGSGTDLNFTGTAYGNGTGGTVNGSKKLFFGDYDTVGNLRPFSGTFNGNFTQFDTVKVNAGSDVTLGSGSTFHADSFDIAGSINSNGKTLYSNGAATLNLLVESTGASTAQFLAAGSNLSVDNRGSLNGAKISQYNLTVTNSGTITGELFGGANITLTNQTAGLLSAATLASDGAPTTLSIVNASRNGNTLTTTGTFNAQFGAGDQVTWVNNTGVLTLGNTGTLTVGTAGHTGVVSNTAGDLTWNNQGTLTYYGNILGNNPGNTGVGHIALNNVSGTSTFHGVYNATYGRDVVVLGQNPNAGSSLAITNTSGTMQFNGAVIAVSSERLNITNRGTMNFVSTTNGVVNTNILSTVNSFGPGGFLVENYGVFSTDGFRNECQAAGQSSGNAWFNNYSGTVTVPNTLTVNGRLFTGSEVLPLVNPDEQDILIGQKVAVSNIGANGMLHLNNQTNAEFKVNGVLFNADGAGLQVVNSGVMDLGYTYTGSTVYRDSIISSNDTEGIAVSNTGALHFHGTIRNVGTGVIDIENNAANAVLVVYGTLTDGVYGDAVVNSGSGNIAVNNRNTSTASQVYIYGNIVNQQSGSITVSNYTLIQGNAVGKNVNLFAGNNSTFNGTVTGGDILDGEDTYIDVVGGNVVKTDGFIAGYTGSAAVKNTNVTVRGGSQVSAQVVGGGNGVAITGNVIAALSNSTFNNKIYGGGYGVGANIAGTVDLTITDSSVTSLIFGGCAGGGNVTGKITLTLTNSSTSSVARVYGGGAGNVGTSGNTSTDPIIQLTVTSGIHSAVMYAGAMSDSVYSSSKTVYGNVRFDLSGTNTVLNSVIQGGGLNNNTTGDNRITGKTTMTLTDVTVNNFVYGGGYAVSRGSSTLAGGVDLTLTDVNFTAGMLISGGGRATGDGYAIVGTQGDTTTGAKITFNGAATATSVDIYGGGITGGGYAFVYGGSNITVNSGNLVNVYGGGWGSVASTMSRSVVYDGSIITINGGTISGTVCAGGRGGTLVNGDAKVMFTSSAAVFSGTVTGAGVVAGNRTTLEFTSGYSGDFNATIKQFNTLLLDDDATVNLTKTQSLAGVASWGFDLVDRSTASQDNAMLTQNSGSNNFLNDRIDLWAETPPVELDGWTLLHVNDDTTGLLNNINLAAYYLNGQSIAYNTVLSGDFAGWKVCAVDTNNNGRLDTLKFGVLA